MWHLCQEPFFFTDYFAILRPLPELVISPTPNRLGHRSRQPPGALALATNVFDIPKSTSSWDEASPITFSFNPSYMVIAAVDGCVSVRDLRRFLERCRRDETIGGQRSLGDSGSNTGFPSAGFCRHFRELVGSSMSNIPLLTLDCLARTRYRRDPDPHLWKHLPNDDPDMLIVDRHTPAAGTSRTSSTKYFSSFGPSTSRMSGIGRSVHEGLR